MRADERINKVMHRIDSAIYHMELLAVDRADDDVQYIIGHLKRAQEKVHAMNFSSRHKGKKLVQTELF